MQLKSEIWVHAFLRACVSNGGMPVVVRHGDDDAGVIFIKLLEGIDRCQVYGPRPISFESAPLERLFAKQLGPEAVPEATADAYLSEQTNFDPDLWVIEVGSTSGLAALEPWL